MIITYITEMAVTIADDEADPPEYRRLSQACKDDLEQLFEQQFDRMLQQQQAPAESQLRSWIRHQLGIKELSYGCDSDSDSVTPIRHSLSRQGGLASSGSSSSSRRSRRHLRGAPAGPTSAKWAAATMPSLAPPWAIALGLQVVQGGGGRQGSSDAQQQMPLTPAAAAPKPRPSRPGRKH
jgi:hypothetical protein